MGITSVYNRLRYTMVDAFFNFTSRGIQSNKEPFKEKREDVDLWCIPKNPKNS